jgi:hypothetical protein
MADLAFIKDTKVIGGIVILSLIMLFSYGISYSSLPYAGGGELVTGVTLLEVDNEIRYPMGQHYINDWDIDGSFNDYNWNGTTGNPVTDWILRIPPDTIDYNDLNGAGITIESSNPYYVEEIGGVYLESEESVIRKTYEKTFGTNLKQYNLILHGFDVTFKTNADRYYKDPAVFSFLSDYGYYFESDVSDIRLRQSFVIAPWTPVGAYNKSYEITGGWAGILDTEIYAVEKGLVQEGATENFGHTIQNLHSVGSVPNMYTNDQSKYTNYYDFDAGEAIADIPNNIEVELEAKLGAGAEYHVDALGHWDSCTVRNVFVTYKVLVRIVATIDLSFVTEGSSLEEPEEDNTFYKPQVPILSDWDMAIREWWAEANEFLASPAGLLSIIAVVIGGTIIIVLVFRRR